MAHLLFATVCLFFGSNFILMDQANNAFGPLSIGLWRLIGGAVVLAPLWAMSRQAAPPLRRWPDIVLVAVLANSIPYAVQPIVIANGVDHHTMGMLVSLTPLATILSAIPVNGVWPSARQLVGVVGGMLFLALLMFDGAKRGAGLGWLLAAAAAPCCYAVANTYMKRKLHDLPTLPLTTLLMVFSAAAIAPFVIAETPPTGAVAASVWRQSVMALVALGTLGTGVAMWGFVQLVKLRGPLLAGMVTYVVPLVAVFWGLVDGKTITLTQVVAVAGVLAMVGLVQSASPVQSAGPAAPTETAAPTQQVTVDSAA